MRERHDIWHDAEPGTEFEGPFASVYERRDGRVIFAAACAKAGDPLLAIEGFPKDGAWMIETLKSGTSILLDHRTSRLFRKIEKRTRNVHHRVLRDKARDKEKKRRLALNGRTATAHAAAERT